MKNKANHQNHPNGGGQVSITSVSPETAYVCENAYVYGTTRILDYARKTLHECQ